jgi:amino acid transporter
MSVGGLWRRLRRTVVGPPRDPFDPNIREHIALVAFLAWIGLGADGMSSANYGPELGYLALGDHAYLAVFLALLTAVTVFIIALGYNQVIQLFPTGGGGYRVTTSLLGPYPGLVAGVCLVIDYVLTIAISIASGVDALFSMLPLSYQGLKIPAEIGLIFILMALNLRGIKESVAVLMPIFIGFLATHVLLIVYGIAVHAFELPQVIGGSIGEASEFAARSGWLSVGTLLLLAYSLGGGTYTGIEAVSNNIHTLAEPRIRTGRTTMMYMAASLAFIASGIILLYLLWHVEPVEGQTLNAVVFRNITQSWTLFGQPVGPAVVSAVLVFEAGLLFVAANTGFLGGPAVLANMAQDEWVPHQARHLSNRLVTQNGIMLMGLAALAVLILARGAVEFLVVLYSMSVFCAFALTLLGMCVYWVKHPTRGTEWLARLALSGIGFLVCAGILAMISVERFSEGGWVTILLVGIIVWAFARVRRHYQETRVRLHRADRVFARKVAEPKGPPPPLQPTAPTAIFLIGGNLGTGMHSLLWVRRLFPQQFHNFVFVRTGEVDTASFGGEARLEEMTHEVDDMLNYFVAYCHNHGLAAEACKGFGTDTVETLVKIVEKIVAKYPNAIVFASKLIFEDDAWWTRVLHNQTALTMQRQLHLRGIQMVILPMIVHAQKGEKVERRVRRSFHWMRPSPEAEAETERERERQEAGR